MEHARILVADDEASTRHGLERLLRTEGASVALAKNGAEALSFVKRTPPDVVVTDLNMPGMDGVALCEAIRAAHLEVPVIVMTAYGDMETVVRTLRAGAVDFLVKPLDFELVKMSVERALRQHASELERRHLEEVGIQAEAALRRQDDFLAKVLHDLREPLAILDWGATNLEAQEKVAPEVKGTVDQMFRAIRRMEGLVEDLWDRSRRRNAAVDLQTREHSVGELLQDARDMRPLALQRSIDLDVQDPPDDLRVPCDRSRMARVFSNLVTNAIKFAPRGSTVRVWAEQSSDAVRFAVKDDGAGISQEKLTHFFERFWQGGNREGGMGLGLFIAKEIVDAHHGTIWVESGASTGCTFWVELPLTRARTKNGV
jgi:signal transduction histidine kinase